VLNLRGFCNSVIQISLRVFLAYLSDSYTMQDNKFVTTFRRTLLPSSSGAIGLIQTCRVSGG